MVRRGTNRTPDRHALGTAYAVVGTRGRRRLVVLTTCPYCDEQHQHAAPLDFLSGRRTAACHGGKYLLHLAAVEGRVAS